MKKFFLGLVCALTLMISTNAFAQDPAIEEFKAMIVMQIDELIAIGEASPSNHVKLNILWTVQNLQELLAAL